MYSVVQHITTPTVYKFTTQYWNYKLREFHSHKYFRLGVVKTNILAIVILIPPMATYFMFGKYSLEGMKGIRAGHTAKTLALM